MRPSGSYLAHVVDKLTPEVVLVNVPIVQEFSNVFSKDLLGPPPDRELEFKIELLSGSTPISIPPYRMTLVELKELKIQLQDLVDNGFHPT